LSVESCFTKVITIRVALVAKSLDQGEVLVDVEALIELLEIGLEDAVSARAPDHLTVARAGDSRGVGRDSVDASLNVGSVQTSRGRVVGGEHQSLDWVIPHAPVELRGEVWIGHHDAQG